MPLLLCSLAGPTPPGLPGAQSTGGRGIRFHGDAPHAHVAPAPTRELSEGRGVRSLAAARTHRVSLLSERWPLPGVRVTVAREQRSECVLSPLSAEALRRKREGFSKVPFIEAHRSHMLC